jgi:hypothetical protein
VILKLAAVLYTAYKVFLPSNVMNTATKVRNFANHFIKDARKPFQNMVGFSALMTFTKIYICSCCSFEDISHFIIKFHGISVGVSLVSALP